MRETAQFTKQPGPWRQELTDYIRALSGAYLFGVPLLYTMEMWWLGESASTGQLLVLVGIAVLANLGITALIGFRRGHSHANNVEQTIDVVAVGILGAVLVLLALNRIAFGDPLAITVGKIAVVAVPLSIGASVANAVFSPEKSRQGSSDEPPPIGQWRATLNDVGATAVGGTFVGFSIAPTEEIPMLATEMTFGHLLALMLLSLLLTYSIVFASGFDRGRLHPPTAGFFSSPLAETAMAYSVSWMVALVTLMLFNSVDLSADPPRYMLAQTAILALPTTIGGAAGRLVV